MPILMPGPNSSKAPAFSGEISDLVDYLDHFEYLATLCDLTEAEKCKWLVRYTDLRTKRFWICLSGYESRDFDAFKKSILSEYPMAENGLYYTVRDLGRIVSSTTDSDISTEDDLMEYYHEFISVAYWLVRNDKISCRERDRYFWKGLPLSTRCAIDQWLIGRDADYNRDEVPDFEKVLKAGRSMFSFEKLSADLDDSIASRLYIMRESLSTNSPAPRNTVSREHVVTDDKDERKDAPGEVRAGEVASQPSTSILDEVEDLARKMHNLDISDAAYSCCYTRLFCLAPAAAQAWAPPRTRQLAQSSSLPAPPVSGHAVHTRSDPFCYFCGQAHRIRNCPTAVEYIRIGRVVWEDNYFLFSDHSVIRRAANGTIQQAVDERYGNSILTPPPS
jgi:hypothetical protein